MGQQPVDLETLRRLKRFSQLKNGDLEVVSRASKIVDVEKGSVLFLEGSGADGLMVVVRGYVKISKNLDSPRGLRVFGPGHSLGEPALVSNRIYPGSAVALTSSTILSLPLSVYEQLSLASPVFAENVTQAVAAGSRFMADAMVNFVEGDAEERVVRFIKSLLLEFGICEDQQTLKLPFYLSRQEVASFVNLRTETVSRIMSRWEADEKLVSTSSGFVAKANDWLQS